MEHLIVASIELGDPLGVSDEENRKKVLHPHRMNRAHLGFLEQCESTAICGPDGTILKVDSLYFFESPVLYWTTDWFPPELIGHELYFFFLNANTFMVDLENWHSAFSDLFREFNPDDWPYLNHTAEMISHFQGWAFCISEEDDAQMLEYIIKSYELPPELLDKVTSENTPDRKGRTIGRPPLEKAKAAFAEMGFKKGNRSWEELARHLERKTGQKPAPKTMRSWVSDAKAKQPPRALQGEIKGK
ncbi:hypothetical protein [Roseovarius litoreus]|uniref:hypothetical protein n=1 Tax=Roseovarius litoreus TaxID=1155722 RepID=UPI00122CE5AF|nr:hypothetical protein [Roseovarius litoreus]